MDYTITRCNNDDWVKVNGKNAKGETLEIQICHMKNSASPSSIMNTWYREGYIDTILDTYLICHTYVLDSEGNGFMRYDITSKLSEDGKRHVINFEWLLEDTPENMIKIIEACIDLFKSATGKSATEEKVERINKYAEENGLTVTYELPEGWKYGTYMTDPMGSTSINNGEPQFIKVNGRFVKNPKYKRMLLIY